MHRTASFAPNSPVLPTNSRPLSHHVCGKAILLGEHFVVYGAPAIALAIPDAVRIEARPHPQLQLDIPQWSLSLHPDPNGKDLERALAALAKEFPAPAPVALNAHIRLPSGVGLGSSAALGVAVLRALNRHQHWQLSKTQQYEMLFSWERVFHGNPSGFDHATAMHHGLTYFERFKDPPIQSLPYTHDLDVIIAQVDAGASTKEMVEGVRRWKDTHPTDFKALLSRADRRATQFLTALHTPDLSPQTWRQKVGQLLQENQQDLQTIGVSTPALNAACDAAEHAGAHGAKLIGAGGGGCILALVDSACHDAVYNALRDHSHQRFSLRLAEEVPS